MLTLRLAPLAVLAAAALPACAGTMGLAPTLAGVEMRLTGVDLDGVDLAFDVGVDNPLPVEIPAPRIDYTLGVEGSQFASAGGAKGRAVPASGAGVVTVPLRVGFRELAKVVSDLDGRDEASYDFSGNVALPALGTTFRLPFRKAGKFPVVRAPSLSVRSVDTSGISLTGGTLVLDADLTNPNAFELGIDDLGWQLDAGKARIGGLRASSGGAVGPKQTRTLRFEASISASEALQGLLASGKRSGFRIVPTGALRTPYGDLPLSKASLSKD